jgi:hypothetical protein
MVIGFLICVPCDPRDSIPLGHDGDWLPERDAFPGLPALDARHPPPLSTTCQESGSANMPLFYHMIIILA